MIICFAMVGTIASQSFKEEKASVGEITVVEEESFTESEKTVEYGSQFLGLMLGLLCSVFCAIVLVLNRALKETPAPIVIFYHTTFGILLALVYIIVEAIVTGKGTRINDYTMR